MGSNIITMTDREIWEEEKKTDVLIDLMRTTSYRKLHEDNLSREEKDKLN